MKGHGSRNMVTTRMVLFLLFVLFASVGFSQTHTTPKGAQGPANYQAIVGTREATFTFPVTPHQQYDWSERGIIGIWLVKIRNGNQQYECGYSIDNPLGGALGSAGGTLNELLTEAGVGEAGAGRFWQCNRVTARSMSEVNDVTVRGVLSDDQRKLMITLSGTGLKRLFSSKPQYCVLFESNILNGRSSFTPKQQNPDHSTRVAITYRP